MINIKVLEKVIFDTIKRGSCFISKDVRSAFAEAIEKESTQGAKEAFHNTLKSLDLSIERVNPACPDTGWPLFYFKIGNEVNIEGGPLALEEIARQMVTKATKEGYLRSTMKHPLTGYDPGTNVGMNIPDFTYKFVPGENIEITFVAKGGGSECFGGTRYNMIAFADGLAGIEKFILDAYAAAARAGAICPPAVLGVGIGGTGNIAANLAKEAASLRLVGSHHPEEMIARIEDDLYNAINSLGIGPMGSGGDVSVFGVNVEYAYTHIAGIAVALSSNCWIARRATNRVYADGRVEQLDNPNWFEGR
ncbi:MAG: hypothetical protein CVU87_11285 [Firmicutes bacterium HGW-Firmicutes-12]|nr:MAG: hypothetical protein CVU87_11285 [Firmicutes bacterium HGW-Firmicutes-12]